MNSEEEQGMKATASLDILRGTEHPLTEEPEFLKKLHWWGADIDGNLLDVKKDIQRPLYTLSYNGVPFAPLGAIHALTGQKKNGKTMAETLLMTAILKGDMGGLRYELNGEVVLPSVLYVDTEMEEDNSLMVARRVHHVMGWPYQQPSDRFRVLWLRGVDDVAERWRKTIKAIWTYRPTVVFLDGIRDVIGDFNDSEESSQLVYQCMQVATEFRCSLWCVLHENPGSDKMRGHLGTELGNKISDTFVVKKTKGASGVFFTVSQIDARGKDVDDFKFEVKDDDVRFGIPTLVGQDEGTGTPSAAASSETERLASLDAAMKDAIQPPHSQKYTELVETLTKNLKKRKQTVCSMVKEAINIGIIGCINGHYTYRGLSTDEENTELPFPPPD